MLVAGPKDAEPLFLIPGVAGCAALWRRQLPTLGREFRVYALDIPGQPGRSDPNPPSFLNDDYCDWLCDVLDDLGIERAHFAGVSVGGWIAMRMGIVAPQRVRKVVMLGTTGIARARLPVRIWLSRVLTGLRSSDVLEGELTAKNVSSAVTKAPGKAFGTFDRQLAKAMALCTKHYRVDRSLGIYDETTRRIRLWDGLKVLRRFFLAEPRAVLRRFAVPGFIVYGRYEVLYNPYAICRKATRLMGNVQTAVVEDAGHAAIYDRPEYVDGLITDFLKK
jgi:pimeloyl-ACP methyl ester carboxylesterase